MSRNVASHSLTAEMRSHDDAPEVEELRPSPTETPCPTPLSWRQVLQRFRSESEAWTLNRGPYPLTGRTWGEGPPLYVLNGLGGTHELLALTVWLLRETHRCVVYDYPDRASSDEPAGKPSANQWAEDLLAIADRHGDDRFAVLASSFGSLIALAAMRQAPQRIGRAILQAGFAHRRLSRFEGAIMRLGRHLPGTLDRVPLRRTIQQQTHRPWFPPFDRSRWQFFLQNTGQVPIANLAHRAEIVHNTDLRPELSNIRPSVLLVRCEGDGRVAGQCSRELETHLPHARVEHLASCGQLPYLTHPHRLVKIVKSFLDECTLADRSRN